MKSRTCSPAQLPTPTTAPRTSSPPPDGPSRTGQAHFPMLPPHSLGSRLATSLAKVHCLSIVKELPPKANGAPEGAPLARTSPYPDPTHLKTSQQQNSTPHSYESNHQGRTKVTT